MIPPGGYKAGKMNIKFTKLEQGVTIYLTSTDNTFEEVQILKRTNDKSYEIDNDKAFIVTAVPSINSYNTTFSFDYSQTGDKINDAPIWAKLEVHKDEVALLGTVDSSKWFEDNMELVIAAASGILVICLLCSVFMCMKKRQKDIDDN